MTNDGEKQSVGANQYDLLNEVRVSIHRLRLFAMVSTVAVLGSFGILCYATLAEPRTVVLPYPIMPDDLRMPGITASASKGAGCAMRRGVRSGARDQDASPATVDSATAR